jgi:hypothetical protein
MGSITRKFTIISILLIGALIQQISSQTLISAAGNSFQNENITIDWSPGEIAISTLGNDKIIITQGFHQEIVFPTSIFQTESGPFSMIFPNPASEILSIRVDDPEGNRK